MQSIYRYIHSNNASKPKSSQLSTIFCHLLSKSSQVNFKILLDHHRQRERDVWEPLALQILWSQSQVLSLEPEGNNIIEDDAMSTFLPVSYDVDVVDYWQKDVLLLLLLRWYAFICKNTYTEPERHMCTARCVAVARLSWSEGGVGRWCWLVLPW